MKVLFITPNPIFGGAATATISIASLLKEQGVDIIYNDEYDEADKRGGLPVDHYPYHKQKYSFHKKVIAHIEDISPDYILWSPHVAIYYYREIRELQRKGIKHLCVVHSLSLSQNLTGKIIEYLVSKVLHIIDATVFVSNYTLQSWSQYKAVRGCKGKNTVIYNSVAASQIKKEIINPSKLGFVGRFSSEKQPGIFCSLQNVLKGEYELHAWGDGPLIEECKHNYSSVIYHGQENNINAIYDNIDILVMTSVFENCPMVILEAKIRGIPCVAPNVGGIPEIITNGVDGVLYDGYNVQVIEEAIKSVKANYLTYRNNCIKASEKYTFERIGQIWMQLLSTI